MIRPKWALDLFSKSYQVGRTFKFLPFYILVLTSSISFGEVISPSDITCSYFACENIEKETKIIPENLRSKLKKKFNLKGKVRPLVQFYTAKKNEQIAGYSLIDSHKVRTKNQALLFIFSPRGTILSIELLAFFEPKEYSPQKPLLEHSKNLNNRLGREISIQTGATLTAYAVDRARKKAHYLFNHFLTKDKPALVEKKQLESSSANL